MNRTRSSLILSIVAAACEADTRGLDRLGVPDAGRMECRRVPPEIITGTIEGAPRWSPPEGVDVSGGLIYLHRDFGGMIRIVEHDPSDGSSTAITDPDAQAYLLDAGEDAALWIEQPLGAMDFALVHRSGGTTLLRSGESSILVQDDDAYVGRDQTQVTSDSATWRGFDGIWRWDRGIEARTIFVRDGAYLDAPSIGFDRVVFTVRGSDASILMLQRGGMEPEALLVGDVAWPVSSAGSIFYVEEGRLTKFDVDSWERATLHEGPCGPPYADGERVVAACRGAGWPAPGEVIAYYDGVETHELFDDGGYHFAPRLAEGRIVWIRYRSPDVVCAPREPGGEVRWWDPDTSAEPMILGEVGAPCLCCDAYWPPAVIAFDGEIAAWNYALSDDPESSFVGWGKVVRREVCGP